jgi:hypothetical protein
VAAALLAAVFEKGRHIEGGTLSMDEQSMSGNLGCPFLRAAREIVMPLAPLGNLKLKDYTFKQFYFREKIRKGKKRKERFSLESKPLLFRVEVGP